MTYHLKFATMLMNCVARQLTDNPALVYFPDQDESVCKSAFTDEHECIVSTIMSRGGQDVFHYVRDHAHRLGVEGFRQLAEFYRGHLVRCEYSTLHHLRYVVTLAIIVAAAVQRGNEAFLDFALHTVALEGFHFKKSLQEAPPGKKGPTIEEELAGFSRHENILEPYVFFYVNDCSLSEVSTEQQTISSN